MKVYPNPSPYYDEVIPMPDKTLLEPSFADALTAIERATELPASKRTHWACSLRQLAKWLERPLVNLAARWGAVALKANQLPHVNLGVEWKTLANHRANAKAALQWFCDEHDVPRRGAPLSSEWQGLRSRIRDLSRRAKLSGLIRYCSITGMAPVDVNEAAVDAYMRYRAETTALATDIKARRAIARAWNACAAEIEGWPQQRVLEPPLRVKAWPQWQDFPTGLRNELDAYLTSLTKPRRSSTGKRLRRCKPLTIKTRRVELVGFAKKAVRLGIPIEDLSSLAVLLAPEVVEKVIDSEWAKNGEQPKISTIDMAKKLYGVARAWGCLDGAALDRLDDLRADLEQYRPAGMTEKNLNLIRQVLNEEVWTRVVNCPAKLMRQARSMKDRAPVKAAVTAQIAVAIAILSVAPVRSGNLATIRFDENLIKPGGPGTPYLLVFPDYDVKNRVALTFGLEADVTALIDEYVHDYRPAVVRGSNEPWLFPGGSINPKGAHLFGIQISERIEKLTGLRMTIHQFRHAAAAIYLKHNPGHYETVRQFLGHRNIRTTVNFYCALESVRATRQFGDLIRERLINPGHDDEQRRSA
jgi:integrase